jgi:hypothetical protein
MSAIDRPHKWKWDDFYAVCERCGRDIATDNSLPTNCLTEAEYRERMAWEEQAEIAAGLMRHVQKRTGKVQN